MNRIVMPLVAAAACATLTAHMLAADGPTTQPGEATMSLVQTLKIDKPEGAKSTGLLNVRAHGGFVYLHPRSHNKLVWCRHGDDGRLVEAGSMELKLEKGFAQAGMVFAGEHLYMVRLGPGRRARAAQIAWCAVDPKTGGLTEKGVVDAKVKTFASVSYEPLIASPDGKQLYLLAPGQRGNGKIIWLNLDKTGRPTLGGQVGGDGVGYAAKLLGETK